jgi:hypothetical protein
VEEKTSNLWSLLPSFDPSVDSAKEYADKVKFLWGICPVKDRSMLALQGWHCSAKGLHGVR